eukprot:3971423-Amphidinium_carterae.3
MSLNIFLTQRVSQSTQQMALLAAPQINVAPPQETSAAERELHPLTYIPFRCWCEICVRSKARGIHHKGNLKSKSIIQMDYTFLKHQGEPGWRTKLVTILTMVETVTGMSHAIIVENKGVTQYGPEVKKFILDHGFINSVTQVDGESALKVCGDTHQSHHLTQWKGWHTKLFNHLRLLRLQMSEQLGIPISRITTDHPIFPWMVKHVGLTHKIFQLGQDETILCQHKNHDSLKIPVRLEPQWSYRIWIGRDTSNGNHLSDFTLTSEGLIKSRRVRRLMLSYKYNVVIRRTAIGTDFKNSKMKEFQDEFIGLPQLMTRYHARQRPESGLQKDDVMPTPGDNIQQKESAANQPAATATTSSTSSSRATSSNQPMEVDQSIVQSSTSTLTPSRPTSMPIIIRPPHGLEDQPVKYRLKTKTSYMGQSQSCRDQRQKVKEPREAQTQHVEIYKCNQVQHLKKDSRPWSPSQRK